MLTEDTRADRKSRPADKVAEEGERLVARLSSTRGTIAELRDRLGGSRPEQATRGGEGVMATAITVGGFVGGVGSALERAHSELSEIAELLNQIGDIV